MSRTVALGLAMCTCIGVGGGEGGGGFLSGFAGEHEALDACEENASLCL